MNISKTAIFTFLFYYVKDLFEFDKDQVTLNYNALYVCLLTYRHSYKVKSASTNLEL